jgi:hypothetical protein
MSLLAPWFLAGFALIAGPIVFHLIRRATRERVAFSSLRFLDVSAPRLDRRSRIQNPWLLALRCAIVALLAFGFARPFFRHDLPPVGVATPVRHVVAVLDESASMRRAGLWDAARRKIEALAARLGPADHFALLTAGNGVTGLIDDSQWLATPARERPALVRRVLAEREPGWGPTPLDAAADAALSRWDDMAETAGGDARRELVIVSDFTASARVAGLANLTWPPHTQVVLDQVPPPKHGNASVHWLGWSAPDGENLSARIRVSRTLGPAGPLQLQLRDAATGAPLGEPIPVDLLAGGTRVLLVPVPPDAPATLKLDLTGDAEDFDNHLFFLCNRARELDFVYLANHAADDPSHARFYLERAIAGWRAPHAHFRNDLPAGADTPALLVVAEPLDAAGLRAARARLESGAFGLVLIGRDEMVATAAALAGETDWQPLATQNADALFGHLDFTHAPFAPFADPLYSDFTRIRFWQPHPLQLPASSAATVVARFDDESPAVLEVPVGRGRLIVWGSGWAPKQSQWVLSSKFVPWLQALAERAAGGAEPPAVVEIGDTARIGRGIAPAAPNTPGIHEMGPPANRRPVALNVPAAESSSDLLPLDTWEKLGVPLRLEAAPAAARINPDNATATALENRQQVWRWLLWLAAALLALESLASFAVSRRATPAN